MQHVVLARDALPDAVQAAERPLALEGLLQAAAGLLAGLDVDLDLVVDGGQGGGVVFLAQGVVPRPVAVHLPEVILVVVGVRVQPLHAPQLSELGLEGAVLGDELVLVDGAPAPEADVQRGRGGDGAVGGGFGLARVRVESRRRGLLEGAEPQRPDVEVFGGVVDKLLGGAVREAQVLDDEAGRLARGVEGAVQHAGVQEVVEEPAEEAVERNALEVVEAGNAYPETATVVAEQVFGEGDVVDGGRGFGRLTGGRAGGGSIAGAVLDVEVVPRVPGAAEGLDGLLGGLLVGQLAGDDDAVVLGEEDAVDVVVGRVLGFGADAGDGLGHAVGAVVRRLDKLLGLHQLQLDQRGDAEGADGAGRAAEQVGTLLAGRGDDVAVAEHHLDRVDGVVEEAVLERGALAGRAREAAAGRDAGELHDDGRHEPVAQGRLDEAVHGDVGLDEGGAGGRVDAQHVGEGADVDGARVLLRPRAVGRAVEDAVGLAALEVAAHGGRDLADGLLVALHGGRGRGEGAGGVVWEGNWDCWRWC